MVVFAPSRFLLTAVVVSLLGACSSTKLQQARDGESADIPQWFYEPGAECGNEMRNLCAVGEGASLEGAENAARGSIAAQLISEVSSLFQSQAVMISDQDLTQDHYTETAEKVIQSQTEMFLVGSEIIKRDSSQIGTNSQKYYALARLRKDVMALKVRDLMREVDEHIITLEQAGSRLVLNPLAEQMRHREELNGLYFALTNSSYPSRVSWQRWRELRGGLDVFHIHVNHTVSSNEVDVSSFANYWRNYFAASGHFVADENESANKRIEIKISAREEHLKVSGFKKMTFIAELLHFDMNNNKRGAIQAQMTTSARSYAQAFERIEHNLKKAIEEKLIELNF